ncbi:MAG: glycosyltransferase family 2 protein [Chloroflexi bacterium]|nr:glycosyltransferase family 2 protein [Chloroflexota bacterium]
MKPSPALTVIVPVYNEAESLPEFLPRLLDFCARHNWELVFVNDGSRDDSKRILESHANPPAVRVLLHKVNRGYGGALKTGLLDASTPYAVTIDGDGQHDPEDILRVFQFALENDADLVIGRRDHSHKPNWYRELGKSIIRRFTRLLMPLPIQDLNSGFKLYRAELAQAYLPVCPDSMAFSDVIALTFLNQKDLVLEHPIHVHARKKGKSSISAYTAIETVMEILNLVMLFNPLKIFLSLSAVCFAFGILWGTPILLLDRGVSVGAMLAIVSGLIFFVIGLVASQLSSMRLGELSARRQKIRAEKK